MITLEINSTDIRIMETVGGKVTTWASRPIEPGVLIDGVVTNPVAFTAALRQLMTSSGIKGKDVTASVSGLYSASRLLLVQPHAPGAAVTPAAVMEEVRQVIPLSEDEAYLTWQTVASTESGQQVMVVAVPKNVIDTEVQALKAVGLNPRVLDLKAMALARAAHREQALILNIEDSGFDVVIVVSGIAVVMRTTAWQPDILSLEDRAEHLAVALELTAGFYNLHNPALPLDLATPLFITGPMSADTALVEQLRNRLEYPVESLRPPVEYPEYLSVSQYAVNIGLALKGSAPSKNPGPSAQAVLDINLLPQVYRPWKPSPRQLSLAGAVLVFIALLFPLYQVTGGVVSQTAVLQSRYDIVNGELARRQDELKKREPLQKVIDQYRAIVAMGGGITEDMEVIYHLAKELGVKLESVNYSGTSITVICQAESYTVFRDYLAALSASGRFTTPIPPPEGYPYITGGTIKLEHKTGK